MNQFFPLAAGVVAAFSSLPSTSQAVPGSERWPGFESSLPLESEWAEEAPLVDLDPSGLSVRFDFGRAPGESALRLTLEGAAPNSAVLVQLGTLPCADSAQGLRSSRLQVLRSDAAGSATLMLRGPIAAGWGACFLARTPAGVSARTRVYEPPSTAAVIDFVPQRGTIVITEIMKDPTFVTDAHGEWFELQNVTNKAINIAGWKISDGGSNSHNLINNGGLIVLFPGQRYVLGNDKDPATNGGVHVDYEYSNFTLGNGADSVILTARRGDVVDQVDYDDGIFWPDVPGASLSLNPLFTEAVLNDDPANWCQGQTPLSLVNTDLGTPLQLNDGCP